MLVPHVAALIIARAGERKQQLYILVSEKGKIKYNNQKISLCGQRYPHGFHLVLSCLVLSRPVLSRPISPVVAYSMSHRFTQQIQSPGTVKKRQKRRARGRKEESRKKKEDLPFTPDNGKGKKQ